MLVEMFMKGLVVRATLMLTLCYVLTGPSVRAAYAQPTQPAQAQFVPIDELPPEDQMPAAPLLIVAYAFAWVALLVYLWSIWRRLSGVERALAEVARRVSERGRSG